MMGDTMQVRGDGPRVLSREQLEEAVGTPGIERRSAFAAENYWFGHVQTDPATMSAWHHHGEMVTFGYVLKGRVRLEYGPDGTRSIEAVAGDYVMIPPRMVHREGNPTDEPGELVMFRLGSGQPVFPMDGPAST
jgi:uncharacterized RmlC-like cupin family protein